MSKLISVGVKSQKRLVKLGRGHSCGEGSGHGSDNNCDSTPAYRQVAFRVATVLVVARGFLLNLAVHRVISFSVSLSLWGLAS